MKPKFEKDGEDENSEVDSYATLEKSFVSTTKTWKEIGRISKEGEVDQELEKVSQEEHKNHNQVLMESQEDIKN